MQGITNTSRTSTSRTNKEVLLFLEMLQWKWFYNFKIWSHQTQILRNISRSLLDPDLIDELDLYLRGVYEPEWRRKRLSFGFLLLSVSLAIPWSVKDLFLLVGGNRKKRKNGFWHFSSLLSGEKKNTSLICFILAKTHHFVLPTDLG